MERDEPDFDEPDFHASGLVRRSDLPLSDGTLARAVRSGRLRRLYRDVYATADCTLEAAAARRRAALLYAGSGAYLSCASACAEWGLLPLPPQVVHVTTITRQVRPARLLVPHRAAVSTATQRGDVRLSRVEAAVFEAFGCLSRSAGTELLTSVLGGRKALPERLRDAALPGMRARPAFLALVDEIAGGTHSAGESALLRLVRDAGLPEPTRQLRLRIGGRTAYVDMAFERERVIVEADSRRWHFDADARAADLRRDALLGAEGWIVLRFLYEQIINEPGWVAEQIRATLAARALES